MLKAGEEKVCNSDIRKSEAAAWAAEKLGRESVDLQPVSADASFRRYFRFSHDGRSIILMDAPPDREDSAPFVDIGRRIRSAGLLAPSIFEFDLAQGFGLLEDFGDTLYRELINEDSAPKLFGDLLALLAGMADRVDAAGLPEYGSPLLQTELNLFPDWYLARHRERPFNGAETRTWNQLCETLIASAQKQPQVFVHRDFHSCNLLHTPGGPGLIDFQDGVRGPLSYDLVSLLWDRYIAWPREQLEFWMEQAYLRFQPPCERHEWVRYCDWMSLQRNLKIVGIFARLYYRDGKEAYLDLIPRFYGYLLDVLPLYPEFSAFQALLETDECAP